MVKDRLDAVKVEFDDERAVSNAGVLLVATLAQRLGLDQLVGECVRLGTRGARFRPGRKVMSLVFAMLLGADCIDGCDVLRSGRTGRLLGVRVMAPSTLATFLRVFTFGHVRQLPGQVWALDFQFDQTADGRVLKLLNVVDEYTREALEMLVERRIDADSRVDRGPANAAASRRRAGSLASMAKPVA
jgi:hypothetical protein